MLEFPEMEAGGAEVAREQEGCGGSGGVGPGQASLNARPGRLQSGVAQKDLSRLKVGTGGSDSVWTLN